MVMAKRIWVMDRGMVSQENIEFFARAQRAIHCRHAQGALRQFETALLEDQDWKQVRPEVEVKLLPHPDGKGHEQFILCRSQARRDRKSDAGPAGGAAVAETAGNPPKPAKEPVPADQIERRVGRWLGRFPAADKLFAVEVQLDEQRQACALNVAC